MQKVASTGDCHAALARFSVDWLIAIMDGRPVSMEVFVVSA